MNKKIKGPMATDITALTKKQQEEMQRQLRKLQARQRKMTTPAMAKKAVLQAAGLIKESFDYRMLPDLEKLPGESVLKYIGELATDLGPAVASDVALTTASAAPMVGYTHAAYKDLQEKVPEAYRPAALTGGAIGGAALGAGGAALGQIALKALADNLGAKGLGKALHSGAAPIVAGILGGTVGGIPGYELGERAGLATAEKFFPDRSSEIKHKLGI